MRGIKISDTQLATLDFKFNYNTPANHKEIIENMKVQYDMGAISTETIMEQSPYIVNVADELVKVKRKDEVEKVDETIVVKKE